MAVLRLFQTLIKRELDSGKSRKGFKGRKRKLQRVFVWGGKFGSLLRQTNKSIDLATWTSTTRGCHRRCTIKGVPKKCAKFTRKLVCPNFCFNKVVGLKQTQGSPIQVFSCEFCKILRTHFADRTPPDDCL